MSRRCKAPGSRPSRSAACTAPINSSIWRAARSSIQAGAFVRSDRTDAWVSRCGVASGHTADEHRNGAIQRFGDRDAGRTRRPDRARLARRVRCRTIACGATEARLPGTPKSPTLSSCRPPRPQGIEQAWCPRPRFLNRPISTGMCRGLLHWRRSRRSSVEEVRQDVKSWPPGSCTTWPSCRAPSAAASATGAPRRRSRRASTDRSVDLSGGPLRDVPFVGPSSNAHRARAGARPASRPAWRPASPASTKASRSKSGDGSGARI